jgi:hypothetical protein
MLTPDGTDPPDRPVVVRVTSGRTMQPALMIATLVVTLVGVALWKPWANGGQDAGSPPRAARPGPAVAPAEPRPATAAATPRRADAAVRPALPALYGLDLSLMGTDDGHASWGIAVAHAPSGTIARAVAGRLPTFAPVVDWVSLKGGASPGPTGFSRRGLPATGPIIDHPGTVTIAVAVTWPPMAPPRAVRLVRTGTIASTDGAVIRLPAARPIPLAEPLPLLVRLEAPGFESFDIVPVIDWELRPGTFFLPAEGHPPDVAGWLTGGWRPGSYAFLVTQWDGSTRKLPFVLRG